MTCVILAKARICNLLKEIDSRLRENDEMGARMTALDEIAIYAEGSIYYSKHSLNPPKMSELNSPTTKPKPLRSLLARRHSFGVKKSRTFMGLLLSSFMISSILSRDI